MQRLPLRVRHPTGMPILSRTRSLLVSGSLAVAAQPLLALPAVGHPLRGQAPGDVLWAWLSDPWALLSLGIVTSLYARGVGRLWSRAGQGRGIPMWRFRAFCAGLFVTGLALLSPIDPAGASIFSAHMLQHELLMLVAAPLLVLGAPMVAFAWAVPPRASQAVRRTIRAPVVDPVWRSLTGPIGATIVHALALWVWHAPVLYEATVENSLIHMVQHACFFGSALLFWWVVLRDADRVSVGGIAVVLVFITMLHSNVLGALLTFTARPWYPSYASTAPAWGLTPLEDQQLGGVLMWIPAGTVYMAAMLFILYRWVQRAG